MKLVVNKETKVVVLQFEDSQDVFITEEHGIETPILRPEIKPSSFDVIFNAPMCPWEYADKIYAYDNTWFISDEIAYNTLQQNILQDTKQEYLHKVNFWRQEANFGNFTFRGKEISCDALSRSDIDGANGYISLSQAFPITWLGKWKAVDNSYVDITTLEDWKDFYRTMIDNGTNNFIKSQLLKGYIMSCTNISQLKEVSWDFTPPVV